VITAQLLQIRTVFALPREKRAAWLKTHKEYVIKRLNADFQKPWFAEKDGQPADLGEMTYQETVSRLVRLLFVKHQARWIDPTLRNLVGDCQLLHFPPITFFKEKKKKLVR
jgi:enoyl reductase-like protein